MSHLRLALAALSLCLGSCTTENPLYVPESIGDSGRVFDLSTGKNADLSGPTKDFGAPAMMCMNGERLCTATASARCEQGAIVVDRSCPIHSQCMGGYCQAPPASQNNVGKSCSPSPGNQSEAVCLIGVSGNLSDAPSCQPFVTSSMADAKVNWVCAPRIGAGLSGMPCISGGVCRSGFCGDNGTCFRACVSIADCPTSGGPGNWKCEPVNIDVEGVIVSAPSCIPS